MTSSTPTDPTLPDPSADPATAAIPPEVAEALRASHFGKFVRTQRLGAGGMGEVWKAWDRELARWVALKLPRAGDEQELSRFLREAQTAARLNHPNIAAIYEAGMAQDRPFIAMQLIDGLTLKAAPRADRRALVRAVRDAALAVQFAHERGVIHRDLKPENLMASPAGPGGEFHVYVMDFGLARAIDGDVTRSASGAIVGTPAYMAPEQARGDPVGPPADVYALGATLYELLTGRPPFTGVSAYEILRKVQEEEPGPPRRLGRDIPRDLETIVLKCLEKDPQRRYASAGELAKDLRRYLDGEPVAARRAGWIYRARKFATRRKAATAALAMGSAGLAYVAFALLWPSWAIVRSFPDGARVVVDGRESGMTTPARILLWPPGRRRVDVRLAGYAPSGAEVRARAGETHSVDVSLVKDHGYLSVVSVPPGAEAFLERGGGRSRLGTTPIDAAVLATGVHRLVLVKAGYEAASDSVDIRPDARVPIEKTLRPEEGFLDVTGNHDGTSIDLTAVDRSDLPASRMTVPVTRARPPTGRYRLAFRAPNRFPREAEARIDRDRTAFVHATLPDMRLWSARLPAAPAGPAAVAEISGDPFLDCVLCCSDGSVLALSGDSGRILWQIRVPETGLTCPAVGDLDLDGDGVFDCVTGGKTGRVFALSGRDGALLWEFRGKGDTNAVALADLNGDLILDCVVPSGRVVHALSGFDGRLLWQQDIGEGGVWTGVTLADVNADGVADAIVGTGGVTYVGTVRGDGRPTGRSLVALSGRDGTRLWRYHADHCMTGRPSAADLNGDAVPDFLVGSLDDRIHAVSGADGSRLWTFQTGEDLWAAAAAADLNADGTPDCVMGSYDQRLYALSGRDGAKLWERLLRSPIRTTPAIAEVNLDGVPDVIVGSAQGRVVAISGRDGVPLWEFETASEPTSVTVADIDGDGGADAVFGTADGAVHVVAARDPGPRWEAATGDDLAAEPAHADLDRDGIEDCVIGSNDHRLHAFSGRDGAPLWTVETGNRIWGAPALGDLSGDGVADAVVGSLDSHVYAVSGSDGRLLWRAKMPLPVPGTPGLADVDGDGLADAVVACQDQWIVALSGRDGRALWEHEVRGHAHGLSSPERVDVDGDGVRDCVVELHWEHLRAISGRDGRLLWNLDFAAPSPRVAIHGNLSPHRLRPVGGRLSPAGGIDIVASTKFGTVCAVSGRDGRVRWTVQTPGMADRLLPGPDCDGDSAPDVVVEWGASAIAALSGATGRKIWQWSAGPSQTGGVLRPRAPTVTSFAFLGDGLAVCLSDGSLCLLDGRGILQCRLRCEARFVAGAEGATLAFVAGRDKRVRAVSVEPARPRRILDGLAMRGSSAAALEGTLDLRDAFWFLADGSGVAAAMKRRLDPSGFRGPEDVWALTLAALFRMREGDRAGAAEDLERIISAGADGWFVQTLLFVCRSSPDALGKALARGPASTCEILHPIRASMARASLQAAADAATGLPRAAALVLLDDYDLADAELVRCRMAAAPSQVARLEALLPDRPGPIVDRAGRVEEERRPAMFALALRKATGSEASDVALAGARVLSAPQAEVLLQSALDRADLPESARAALAARLAQLRKPR